MAKIYKKKVSPYWYGSFKDETGRTVRKSTGVRHDAPGPEAAELESDAQAIANRWETQARKLRAGDEPEQEDPSFRALATAYLENVSVGKSRGQGSDRPAIAHLYKDFSNCLWSEITEKRIKDYIKRRHTKEDAAASTVNKELSIMRQMVVFAKDEYDLVLTNPADELTIKEPAGRVRWLTEDELASLLAAARTITKAKHLESMILFCARTGLRRKELLGVGPRDLSRDEGGTLRLEVSLYDNVKPRGRRRLQEANTKTKTSRYVPLSAEAEAIINERLAFIKEHCPKSRYLFCKRDGRPFTDIKKSFAKAVEIAGLDDLTLHDLRHTYASRLAQRGLNLYQIAALLGHRDLKSTQRYAHLCDRSLGDAVKAAFDGEKGPARHLRVVK